MAKFVTIMALAFVSAMAAGCAGEAEQGPADVGAEASAIEAPASASSTPVLGGDLPGLSGRAAIEIAVWHFNNEVGQYAQFEAFRTDYSYNWAYASEGRHYVESYTNIEACGAYVTEAGVFVHQFCYLRIGI